MDKYLWISWETQRRSIELSKKLNCELFIYDYHGFLRFFFSIYKTLKKCILIKPKILFVQNPSMLLAAIACSYGIITKTIVVVDRHSNFLFTKKQRSVLYLIVFKILNWFTIRYADLTIVTNEFIANIIKKHGGRAFILPDRIPYLLPKNIKILKGKNNVLLVSSFNLDEPIKEAITSMDRLKDNGIYLYVTGNYKKICNHLVEKIPENVVFTGFLTENDFIDMLYSVDAIMVLTKIDHCMLCGCYEAIAVEKPLITSKKKVLMNYFNGALFVDNTEEGIACGILEIINNNVLYKNNIKLLKNSLTPKWEKKFQELNDIILGLKINER